MAQILKTELGVFKSALRPIADSRLREFDLLWKAGHYHTAVYMAGYAVEADLKYAICKTLNMNRLPKIFEFHKLTSLLFYSGFDDEMRSDLIVFPSFIGMSNAWYDDMRYEDLSSPRYATYDHLKCVNVDKWLNDATLGLVPWLRSRIP